MFRVLLVIEKALSTPSKSRGLCRTRKHPRRYRHGCLVEKVRWHYRVSQHNTERATDRSSELPCPWMLLPPCPTCLRCHSSNMSEPGCAHAKQAMPSCQHLFPIDHAHELQQSSNRCSGSLSLLPPRTRKHAFCNRSSGCNQACHHHAQSLAWRVLQNIEANRHQGCLPSITTLRQIKSAGGFHALIEPVTPCASSARISRCTSAFAPSLRDRKTCHACTCVVHRPADRHIKSA